MTRSYLNTRLAKHRFMMIFSLLFIGTITLTTLTPSTAHAAVFGTAEAIAQWIIDSFFKPPLEWFLGQVWSLLSACTVSGVITGSFESMLGSGSGTSIYDMAVSVNDVLVKPVAYSVLTLCMLVQLLNMAQKADSDSAHTLLKDLVLLVVFYAVFRFLITYSMDLLSAIYNDLNVITVGISSATLEDNALTLGEINDFGAVFGIFFMIIICFVAALVAYIVCLVMAFMRSLQLYVFSAFAPIPLALLGIDQTRQYGVGFIRNFIALCLAGAVMVFMLYCFPLLVNAALDTGALSLTGVNLVTGSAMLIALCLLLIFGMAKSGSIAKAILGE